jgi:chromosome segregation ATPase
LSKSKNKKRKNKYMSDTPETDNLEVQLGQAAMHSHPVLWEHGRRMERERDTALEQLESTKRRLKAERTAAREAIDAAEAEREKAYNQFYQNPDAAKHEREKAEKQNAEWQEKWTWASNAFAQSIKKIEELEKELSALKSQNE